MTYSERPTSPTSYSPTRATTSAPREFAPCSELPTAGQQIDADQQLIGRAHAARLGVILATITPLPPERSDDPGREQIRVAVNDWIQASGLEFADFDEVIRSAAPPTRIAAEYNAGDHQHPNVTGGNRLAQAMAEAIARWQL